MNTTDRNTTSDDRVASLWGWSARWRCALRHGLRAVLVLVCGLAVRTAVGDPPIQDETRFPYQAIVLADSAEVRSGPGAVHYATDRLAQGSVVEVYRHDPGGWAAIRPPRGSFSLVPAGGIDIREDGSASVAEDGVQAWVGTRLGAVEHPLWQIKMKRGEEVTVLGEVSWPSPEGHSNIWYQIAPPSGEFRWIAMSDIQIPDDLLQVPEAADTTDTADQPAQVERVNELVKHAAGDDAWSGAGNSRDSNQSMPVRPASYEADMNQGNADHRSSQSPAATTATNPNQGWRRATRPIRLASRTTEGPASIPRRAAAVPDAIGRLPVRDQAIQTTPGDRAGQPAPSGFGADASPSISASSSRATQTDREWLAGGARPAVDVMTARQAPLLPPIGTLTDRLGQLELLLTREMIAPPESWRLDEIENMARQILAESPAPAERQQTERLLSKLANCRRIRAEYQQIEGAGAAGSHRPIGTGVDDSVTQSTLYDAHGWLNELVQAGGTKPSTFVLQDDNGKITHHISPAPGLNLRRYLKQRVGIIGERGFHRGYNLDHVTAERIVVLDRTR